MTDDPSRLRRELCDRRVRFFYVFALSMFMLLLMVPYLFVADRQSAMYVVVVLNVIGLGALSAFSGGMVWYCKRNF
ncbi:MAG: hypothetical protein ABEI98_12230 [Halorhabdus sp.]